MAEKQFEPDDPFAMVGVVLPEAIDDESLTRMACCFVEELAGMGYRGEKLMKLFRDPFYRGPHAVYRAKGEAFVRCLIDQIPASGTEAEGRRG